jgi:hypothetical protein
MLTPDDALLFSLGNAVETDALQNAENAIGKVFRFQVALLDRQSFRVLLATY